MTKPLSAEEMAIDIDECYLDTTRREDRWPPLPNITRKLIKWKADIEAQQREVCAEVVRGYKLLATAEQADGEIAVATEEILTLSPKQLREAILSAKPGEA